MGKKESNPPPPQPRVPWGGRKLMDNGGSMDKVVEQTQGIRKDSGKLRWHLIPIPALLAFCKVWHGGSIKYDEEQWRGGMKYTRIYRPMMSHLNKWLTCKSSYDTELGTHHLMMVAWGCFVLYMYETFLGHEKFDDRPDKNTLTEEDFEYEPMPFVSEDVVAAKKLKDDRELEELRLNDQWAFEHLAECKHNTGCHFNDRDPEVFPLDRDDLA